MTLLAHYTPNETPALVCAFVLGIVVGAAAFWALSAWRSRRDA